MVLSHDVKHEHVRLLGGFGSVFLEHASRGEGTLTTDVDTKAIVDISFSHIARCIVGNYFCIYT